jgi:hypothetical protein
MNPKDLKNEVSLTIYPDSEGDPCLSIGWNFDDNYDDDLVDYYRKIAAGLYGLISGRLDDVLSIGDIVEATTSFGSINADDDDEMEIVFTPDDELLADVEAAENNKDRDVNRVVDLKTYRFNPNKHSKH